MTVAAVSMVKDEADVVVWTVIPMLASVDLVVVADNGSTDGTRDILSDLARRYPGQLVVVDEPRFAYLQAETMNRLAERVRDAAWIVPFDADELWQAPGSCCIADALRALPPAVQAVSAAVVDLVPPPGGADPSDPFGPPRLHRPGSLWEQPGNSKVAWRPGPGRVLSQGSHRVEGLMTPEPDGTLRVLHLPYRSLAQAARKVRAGRAALDAAGLPPGSGQHWRDLASLDDDGLAAWWARWTDPVGLEPVP